MFLEIVDPPSKGCVEGSDMRPSAGSTRPRHVKIEGFADEKVRAVPCALQRRVRVMAVAAVVRFTIFTGRPCVVVPNAVAVSAVVVVAVAADVAVAVAAFVATAVVILVVVVVVLLRHEF